MDAREKEELRHAVLEVGSLREGSALTPRQIRSRAETQIDFKVTDEDVRLALEFLKGLGLFKKETDGLGSTEYWTITSHGLLAYERGKIPPAPHSVE